MKKRTQYRSVSDMVRGLSEDPAFAEEFEERLAGRRLLKALMVLRVRAGLSQQEFAERLGVTQSKVSKLESSNDADIRLGDLVNYTGAVGHEMRIFLVPKGQTIEDEVKMHALIIKRLLHRMVRRWPGNDCSPDEAVVKILEEAVCNLTRIVGIAATALPVLPAGPAQPLQVESPDVAEEGSGEQRGAGVDP